MTTAVLIFSLFGPEEKGRPGGPRATQPRPATRKPQAPTARRVMFAPALVPDTAGIVQP